MVGPGAAESEAMAVMRTQVKEYRDCLDRMKGVAEELGLVRKGNSYTGIVNGFPVAVTDAKKAVSCVIQTSIRPKNSVMKKKAISKQII